MALRPDVAAENALPNLFMQVLSQFLFMVHDGKKKGEEAREMTKQRRDEKKEGKQNNHLAGVHFCALLLKIF